MSFCSTQIEARLLVGNIVSFLYMYSVNVKGEKLW